MMKIKHIKESASRLILQVHGSLSNDDCNLLLDEFEKRTQENKAVKIDFSEVRNVPRGEIGKLRILMSKGIIFNCSIVIKAILTDLPNYQI